MTNTAENDSARPVYLYCVARAGRILSAPATGIDENTAVYLIPVGPLTAVVSRIRREDFCGDHGDKNLQDVSWLGPRALRHAAVVEHAMRYSPVLPAGLGAIFSTADKLEDLLNRNKEIVLAFFLRAEGKSEWSIKAMADRESALENIVQEMMFLESTRLAEMPPGTRYFQEKKIRAAAAKELSAQLSRILGGIKETLLAETTWFLERKVLSKDATGSAYDMIANWALLLSDEEIGRIQKFVDELNETHQNRCLSLKVSGPWPPYSFCPDLDMDEGV